MPFLAAIPAGLAAIGGGSAVAGAAGLASTAAGLIGGAGGGNVQTAGQRFQLQNLQDTQNLVNQGPGAGDVSAAAGANRDFASQLQAASQQGGLNPTQEDQAGANVLAGQLFRQRQVGLEQNFLQQQQDFNKQAALQGRNPLDPVFRNKLAQQQTQQQALLQAEQGQFATQYAMQQPGQRLQLQGQRANVLQGLASQALANRQALASMGKEAAGVKAEGEGAGGLGGALAGGLRGFQGGLGAGQQINKLLRNPFGAQ